MSSDGGYCRIFWGRVPWMSWNFSGDLINQCDLSNICCALQLTWKLTNHMKISPCLQDMLCFVKWLPKNDSITHGHSKKTSLKSREHRDDFSLWKYRLPFCFLWWCYNHHPISPTGFGPIPRSQCTHWHLCPSPAPRVKRLRCIFCQLWIWQKYESKWIKIPSSSPNFQIDWISTHPI